MWNAILAPAHPLAPWLALVAGALMLVAGIRGSIRTGLVCPDGMNPNRHVHDLAGALRALLMGGTTIGLGAAWFTGDTALAGLMLVIGGEELYETTMVRWVSRKGFA